VASRVAVRSLDCDTATDRLKIRVETYSLEIFHQTTVKCLLIYSSHFSCMLADGLYRDVILIAETSNADFCC
jgi:hypothetical protein